MARCERAGSAQATASASHLRQVTQRLPGSRLIGGHIKELMKIPSGGKLVNKEADGWPHDEQQSLRRCPACSDRSATQEKNWKVDHWLIRLCTLPTTAPRQTSSMKALTAARVRSVQPVGRYTCTGGGLQQGRAAGRLGGNSGCRPVVTSEGCA